MRKISEAEQMDIACRRLKDQKSYKEFLAFQEKLRIQKLKMEIKPRKHKSRMMAQNNYDGFKLEPKSKLYIPNTLQGGFVK